jgi:hypothetical protein
VLGSNDQTEITARHDEPAAALFHSPIIDSPFSTPGWFDLASHCQPVSTYMTPTVVGRVPRSGLPENQVSDHPAQAQLVAVVSAEIVQLLNVVLRRLAIGSPAGRIRSVRNLRGHIDSYRRGSFFSCHFRIASFNLRSNCINLSVFVPFWIVTESRSIHFVSEMKEGQIENNVSCS